MVLTVIFWVLLLLLAISYFAPEPWGSRGSKIVIVILLAILGYTILSDPTDRPNTRTNRAIESR